MASYLYNAAMAKEKLTIYLDPDVARSMRVSAARRGIKDSDLVEEALRDKLLIGILERAWAHNDELSEDEAMALALRAQREVREERRRQTRRAS
jgi:hypothetical protein